MIGEYCHKFQYILDTRKEEEVTAFFYFIMYPRLDAVDFSSKVMLVTAAMFLRFGCPDV